VFESEIGAGADIEGAIICHGSVIRDGGKIRPGEVISATGSEKTPTVQAAETIERVPLGAVTELPCTGRAAVMRLISENLAEFGADFTDGLQLRTEKGRVRISPASDREAIIIEARADNIESSDELCGEFVRLAKSLATTADN
jgi:hypothetical protein